MRVTEVDSIITADERLRETLRTAENIAASRASVLVRGESGTGKELIARLIHNRSSRSTRRLVAINCAAVPEGLLESELFGYEKGAFTGANQTKLGKFELAHESTLLLDEMGELPLHLQAKLLRVLQEGEVEKLGARHPTKVNVRVVATTNRDLPQMIRRGEFREDLFYRLNVISLELPPLRARRKDVELLARHFVKVSGLVNGKTVENISDGAMNKLMSWHWPGNVRELENVMERAVLLSKGPILQAEDIEISRVGDPPEEFRVEAGMTVSEMEKRLILKTLDHTRQNRTHAARLLGISIRTLRNKLQEYKVRET